MGATDARTLYQWGKESTLGTAVAATSEIITPQIDFNPTDELYRPRIARGLALRNRGFETVVARGTEITVPSMPANFEQLPHWASMVVAGGAALTPTGVGPYVYTQARSLTADPALNAWTFERRLGGSAANRDEEWAYVQGKRLGFSFNMGEALMMEVDLFGRRRQASTLTPALSMVAPEIPAAGLVKVFIDTSWAGLGGTGVLGQVLRGNIDFYSGLVPLATADGRTDLDYTIVVLNDEEVYIEGELVILVDTQYDAEKTAAEAATLRAMRWQVDGTSGRQIQIDSLIKHELATVPVVEVENGQWIVALKFQDATDGTNLYRIKTTNNLATAT